MHWMWFWWFARLRALGLVLRLYHQQKTLSSLDSRLVFVFAALCICTQHTRGKRMINCQIYKSNFLGFASKAHRNKGYVKLAENTQKGPPSTLYITSYVYLFTDSSFSPVTANIILINSSNYLFHYSVFLISLSFTCFLLSIFSSSTRYTNISSKTHKTHDL